MFSLVVASAPHETACRQCPKWRFENRFIRTNWMLRLASIDVALFEHARSSLGGEVGCETATTALPESLALQDGGPLPCAWWQVLAF